MSERMAYVGIAPCGCVRHAAVIDGVDPKHVAQSVSTMVRDKLRVETRRCADVQMGACIICEPKSFQSDMFATGPRA